MAVVNFEVTKPSDPLYGKGGSNHQICWVSDRCPIVNTGPQPLDKVPSPRGKNCQVLVFLGKTREEAADYRADCKTN